MNIPYVFKKCTKCGEIKLATSDNFNKEKEGKYGLKSQCKICIKKYREKNKDKTKEYREKNKEKIKEYQKEYQKKYRENNKDKRKKYRENNKDKIKESQKKYRLSEKGKRTAFNFRSKRRFKEENQGNGITKEQWLEMMDFFEWTCAYSGEYIGGNSEERSIDHIIPLSKGGENEVWNCVPMLRSLNSSKRDKDMLSWYKGQSFYNKWRLNKIQKWQEYAYDKWGK